MTLDFDKIDEWASSLASSLSPFIGDLEAELKRMKPRYVEDSLSLLLANGRREPVIDETIRWIRTSGVYAFHGSRLTRDEVDSVRVNGLRPLSASQRSVRLTRVLSQHPNWPAVAPRLDEVLRQFGQGMRSGRREGQVHLTLSRAGLVDGFNHYLTHGSEFDQHVTVHLLGQEAQALLAADGESLIVKVAVPGQRALEGAHIRFSVDDVRAHGEVPNLVKEFLEVWSYRLTNPGYQSRCLRVDSGIRFDGVVPAEWIVAVEAS